MSTSPVQRFYRYHACLYDATRWTILRGRRRAVEKLALRPASRVLEIGCGTGLNFRHILARLDPRLGRLTGVDFSQHMLVRAQRRVAARGWSNVELIRADASRLELGRRFDGILFAYSLAMIPDWAGALERAYAHLRSGGRLVVHDFGSFAGWGPLGGLLRGWLRLNHVVTGRPYARKLRALGAAVETCTWLGGYNFSAVGRRRNDGSGT